MGKTFKGGTKQVGTAKMLTPEQQQLFSSFLGEIAPQLQEGFGQFLQPQGMEDIQDIFQQTYVDPAQQMLQRQILPEIQQRFVGAGAGSSSALNQALAQTATDLSSSLGQQFGQFYERQRGQQLGALGTLLPLLTASTQQPMIQQQQGILGPLIGAAGTIGAAALSTKDAKENIKDYDKGIEKIRQMNVKQYDYKKDFGGQKDRVGFIAEELPEELTVKKEGLLHADVYGIVSLAVNAIKELDERIKRLEESK